MQHVFIIGSKSIGRYGGFEAFVERLTAFHEGDDTLQYHVACKKNGDGHMDESTLPDPVTKVTEDRFIYHRAVCYKIRVPQIGPAQAIWYDLAALRWAVKEIREEKIPHAVVYILACRIGPFLGHYAKHIRRLGGRVMINPDGHEWMRGKWSPSVRKYWKYSEARMVREADLVICDNRHMEDYIRKTYASFSPKTCYIAYGASLAPSALPDDAPDFTGWLATHGLAKNDYYLVVGRFVPENNYEVMIREFLRSHTAKKLAIVSTDNPAFARTLDEKLQYSKDPRIVFCGSVYDRELLLKIRENAYGYLHGHEVGGTNPSLLEALASTPLNLLCDVHFNREVGGDAALYWSKDTGALADVIDAADALTDTRYAAYKDAAKGRIATDYRWEDIADAYRCVFTA